MGQQASKGEELYQQVSYGNTEGIKRLWREGARLEWVDREGKTPLIVACMNPDLYNVAKTLIELGANINAYRPGRHAGTPLHHAAKRGLESTVKLLLLHGANALVMNDDYQTPIDVARVKGHCNVVRAIESNICLFSGWMREFYGRGFLEILAPQLVSRKVWVVVSPSGSRNPTKPFKLELAIYPSMQDAQPRTVIALWKANVEEPKLSLADPYVIIVDTTRIPRGRRRRRCRLSTLRQTRIKLASASQSDRQQLHRFCDACKGIPPINPAFLHKNQPQVTPACAPPAAEDLELAMALSVSIQSSMLERPLHNACLNSAASSSNTSTSCMNISSHPTSSSYDPENHISYSGNSTHNIHTQEDSAVQITHQPDLIPSAPPISDGIVVDGPVHYPSIDPSPIDVLHCSVESIPAKTGCLKEERRSSSCVICLDAPIEGACIPCGHMAGCMSCLNEIKAKKWGCPVCRGNIDQVVRLYSV